MTPPTQADGESTIMSQQDPKGVEHDTSVLQFPFKDGRLYWELRSERVQHREAKVTLVLNLPMNGVGEVRQTFPLSTEDQFQVVMWLARQLEVEIPSRPLHRRGH